MNQELHLIVKGMLNSRKQLYQPSQQSFETSKITTQFLPKKKTKQCIEVLGELFKSELVNGKAKIPIRKQKKEGEQ